MASSKLKAFWNHPAGPKTIHFWGPTFKWGISIANVADFAKPPETISYPQQIGLIVYKPINRFIMDIVAASGLIWTRYGMVISPINWNLSSVNFAMSVTGFCQISRKIWHDTSSKSKDITPAVEK